MVEPVAVVADGTLLQEKVTTIFELPSHAKLLAEPEPVPKANVFTVLATGVNPLSIKVPA